MENKKEFEEENENLGGRLTLIETAYLKQDQKSIYQRLSQKQVPWADKNKFKASLNDGRLIGPFNFHLRNPATSNAYMDWVDTDGKHTSLASRIREIIILTVGIAWKADYEVYAHTAVGKTSGLTDDMINSLKMGKAPIDFTTEETVAYQFTKQLVTEHKVDDIIYNKAIDVITEKGVVDMVHLIGLYLATSAFLTAFKVPAPDAI